MSVMYSDGLVHELSHVNREKRAGRTWCNRYIEFWPDHLQDIPVTCLLCIARPALTAKEEAEAQRDVDERGDDIVMACKHHFRTTQEDGSCTHCGYSHKMEFK